MIKFKLFLGTKQEDEELVELVEQMEELVKLSEQMEELVEQMEGLVKRT